MQITILRHYSNDETDANETTLQVENKIVNVERDSDQYVTIYGERGPDGNLWYLVLDQELIDKINSVKNLVTTIPVKTIFGTVKVEVINYTDKVLCRVASTAKDLGMSVGQFEGNFGSTSWSNDPEHVASPEKAAQNYVYNYLGVSA